MRGDQAATSALTELRQIDPELPDAICVDNLIFTLKFASANVVSLLHWLLAMLGRHPEWAERMREDAAVVDRLGVSPLAAQTRPRRASTFATNRRVSG